MVDVLSFVDEVGCDGVQAGVGGLGLLAEKVKGLVGIDAVDSHEHAFGLFDGGAGLQGTLNAVGDVAGGLEAGEVPDGARDRGGEQVEDFGVEGVER